VCGKPNADGIDLSFISLSTQSSSAFRARSYTIITCPSWKIHPQDIVDTTGAGDSFIGGFIFAFLNNYAEEDCLRIATWVASEKLRGAGSRSTLPTLQRLRDNAKQSTVK
jgi:sugar/nucleoside kinase (ribokinase family)